MLLIKFHPQYKQSLFLRIFAANINTLRKPKFYQVQFMRSSLKKKIFITALFACTLISVHAGEETMLTIWTIRGEQISYKFSEQPKVSYTQTDAVISTGSFTINHPLPTIHKFTFESISTDIIPLRQPQDKGEMTMNGTILKFNSFKPKTSVTINSINGIRVMNETINNNGSLTLSLIPLPAGIYVVKAGDITYKIAKQ